MAFPGDYGNINTYFWIPIVGPLIGGALASFTYDFGIRSILRARQRPEDETPGKREEREIAPNQ